MAASISDGANGSPQATTAAESPMTSTAAVEATGDSVPSGSSASRASSPAPATEATPEAAVALPESTEGSEGPMEAEVGADSAHSESAPSAPLAASAPSAPSVPLAPSTQSTPSTQSAPSVASAPSVTSAPSVASTCSDHPRVACTYALAYPGRPCPATAIQSLCLLDDMPAHDILNMIRRLVGAPVISVGNSLAPSLAQSPGASPRATPLQTPAATPAATPVQSPLRTTGRQWESVNGNGKERGRSATPTADGAADRGARPVSTSEAAGPDGETGKDSRTPHADTDGGQGSSGSTSGAPGNDKQAETTPAGNEDGQAGTTSTASKRSSLPPPSSRAKAPASHRASLPAAPRASAAKDKEAARSVSASRTSRRASVGSNVVSDQDREDLRKEPTSGFIPDSPSKQSTRHASKDKDGHALMAGAPPSSFKSPTREVKRKSSLVNDATVGAGQDDMDLVSEADTHAGVMGRARPRIQWAVFLPPLASTVSKPDTFSQGVATGRLLGTMHTRFGERRMAIPMLLLAGSFLSAVGGDSTGSRLLALGLDEALPVAGMIEAFLQNATLAETTGHKQTPTAPASNFSGKLAEARSSTVSAHTRVRSNVMVLSDVIRRSLVASLQKLSARLAQEVFALQPAIAEHLETARALCARAGLTLTLWRAIAQAYLAEMYISVLHYLLKLRDDGQRNGRGLRAAYLRIQQSLDAVDTWARKHEVTVHLASVLRSFLAELIQPSSTTSPIVSALDRVRAEHATAHTQAIAILRLTGMGDREARALDNIAVPIEDAVDRSAAAARDLPGGETVVKAVAWVGFD